MPVCFFVWMEEGATLVVVVAGGVGGGGDAVGLNLGNMMVG